MGERLKLKVAYTLYGVAFMFWEPFTNQLPHETQVAMAAMAFVAAIAVLIRDRQSTFAFFLFGTAIAFVKPLLEEVPHLVRALLAMMALLSGLLLHPRDVRSPRYSRPSTWSPDRARVAPLSRGNVVSVGLRMGRVVLALLAVAFTLVGGAFAVDAAYADRALPGLRVAGVHVGSGDVAGIRNQLESEIGRRVADGRIIVSYSERTWTTTNAALGIAPDLDAATAAALSYGKRGGVVPGLAAWLNALRGTIDLPIAMRKEGDGADRFVADLVREFDTTAVDGEVALTATELRVTGPREGRSANGPALQASLLDSGHFGDRKIDLPMRRDDPGPGFAVRTSACNRTLPNDKFRFHCGGVRNTRAVVELSPPVNLHMTAACSNAAFLTIADPEFGTVLGRYPILRCTGGTDRHIRTVQAEPNRRLVYTFTGLPASGYWLSASNLKLNDMLTEIDPVKKSTNCSGRPCLQDTIAHFENEGPPRTWTIELSGVARDAAAICDLPPGGGRIIEASKQTGRPLSTSFAAAKEGCWRAYSYWDEFAPVAHNLKQCFLVITKDPLTIPPRQSGTAWEIPPDRIDGHIEDFQGQGDQARCTVINHRQVAAARA